MENLNLAINNLKSDLYDLRSVLADKEVVVSETAGFEECIDAVNTNLYGVSDPETAKLNLYKCEATPIYIYSGPPGGSTNDRPKGPRCGKDYGTFTSYDQWDTHGEYSTTKYAIEPRFDMLPAGKYYLGDGHDDFKVYFNVKYNGITEYFYEQWIVEDPIEIYIDEYGSARDSSGNKISNCLLRLARSAAVTEW